MGEISRHAGSTMVHPATPPQQTPATPKVSICVWPNPMRPQAPPRGPTTARPRPHLVVERYLRQRLHVARVGARRVQLEAHQVHGLQGRTGAWVVWGWGVVLSRAYRVGAAQEPPGASRCQGSSAAAAETTRPNAPCESPLLSASHEPRSRALLLPPSLLPLHARAPPPPPFLLFWLRLVNPRSLHQRFRDSLTPYTGSHILRVPPPPLLSPHHPAPPP